MNNQVRTVYIRLKDRRIWHKGDKLCSYLTRSGKRPYEVKSELSSNDEHCHRCFKKNKYGI